METNKKQPLEPWARAVIIAVILLFLALALGTAGIGPAAAILGFFGAGTLVLGVILAVTRPAQRVE